MVRMPERELKLQVPASLKTAVKEALRQQPRLTRVPLHAMYFDTPSRELARARVAIRLRQEGTHWVQTLKMPGGDTLTRLELNHERPGPVLDLSLYAGTPAEPALAALSQDLGVRYETQIERQLCQIRTRQGVVELAYDEGVILAGNLTLPVCEMEFELVSGKVDAIFTVARRWVTPGQLVWSPRSKSERGDALAQTATALASASPADQAALVEQFWPAHNGENATLHAEMTPREALAAITGQCLEQIARNAAILSEAETAPDHHAGRPEHLHQLRVGIRRLRSAWRLFAGIAELPPEPVRDTLTEFFGLFGTQRDSDVLFDTIAPALHEAGMPNWPHAVSPQTEDVAPLVAASRFQHCLLDLLAWSLGAPLPTPRPKPALPPTVDAVPAPPTILPLSSEPAPEKEVSLRTQLIKRLRRWHERIVADGQRYASLDWPARHDVRKRVKRLRYGLAFAQGLLPEASTRRYSRQLARAQNLLGQINDLATAHAHYDSEKEAYPQAWFALGWVNARIDVLTREAVKLFDQLAEIKGFWK